MSYNGDGYVMKNKDTACEFLEVVAQESKVIAKLEMVWSMLGEIYLLGTDKKEKDLEKALSYYNLVLEHSKDRSILQFAMFRIGENVYYQGADIPKAQEYLKKVISVKATTTNTKWAKKEAIALLKKMDEKKR